MNAESSSTFASVANGVNLIQSSIPGIAANSQTLLSSDDGNMSDSSSARGDEGGSNMESKDTMGNTANSANMLAASSSVMITENGSLDKV